MNERIGLGLVLSNEESAEKFCCHIFSLSVIKNLCKACFTLEVMESFLKVCSCVYKLQLDVSSESDTDSCTTTSCNSIELPSNSIWTILLLSEIFGTTRVTLDCKRKLAELLVGSLTNGSPLPPIFSDEENVKDEKLMEQQLLTHFLRFGPCIVDNNSITSKSPNFSSIHAHNLSLTNLKSREKRQFKKVIPVTEASPAESLDPSESRTSKSLKSDRNDDEQSQNSWESSHFDSVHSSLLTSELQEPKTVDNHREVEQSPQLNHPPLPETEYRPAGSAIGERLSARRNKSSKSSLEELILSRNLAMLRIKEAKIKKDLEESKIEATKMLTESRLRMLDLKTRALLSSSEKKVGKGLQRHPMGHSESPSRGIGVGTLKSPTALVNVESYIEKIDQATSTTKARLLEKKVEQKSTLTQKFDQDSRSNKKELKRNPSTPKERPPNIHSTSEISPIHLLNDSHFIESRVYSQDALKAVGLGFSPSFVTSSEQDRKVQNHKPFDGSAITKLSAQPLFVEVVLVRAWDLVECLGGTNAYVLLKVCQEQYVSHVIHNTTSPFFGTIFKLPLVPKDFSESGEKIYLRVSPIVVREKLNIVVMNKNLSLSDEVIGMTETVLEFRSTSQEYESMILNLKSEFGEYTGNVEIQVKLLSHS